jgi:hypothetical protein
MDFFYEFASRRTQKNKQKAENKVKKKFSALFRVFPRAKNLPWFLTGNSGYLNPRPIFLFPDF